MKITVAEQCNIHMQIRRHISSWAYAIDGICMHTSASGHIIDYSKFIYGVGWSNWHMLHMYDIWGAYLLLAHIMVITWKIKVTVWCSEFWLIDAVLWGLPVDYIICTPLQSSWPKEWSGAIDNTVWITWH